MLTLNYFRTGLLTWIFMLYVHSKIVLKSILKIWHSYFWPKCYSRGKRPKLTKHKTKYINYWVLFQIASVRLWSWRRRWVCWWGWSRRCWWWPWWRAPCCARTARPETGQRTAPDSRAASTAAPAASDWGCWTKPAPARRPPLSWSRSRPWAQCATHRPTAPTKRTLTSFHNLAVRIFIFT